MASYPYYTEPTHDRGTVAAAPRTTAVSEAEGRLIVNVVNKIFLLEPNKHPLVTLSNLGLHHNFVFLLSENMGVQN